MRVNHSGGKQLVAYAPREKKYEDGYNPIPEQNMRMVILFHFPFFIFNPSSMLNQLPVSPAD